MKCFVAGVYISVEIKSSDDAECGVDDLQCDDQPINSMVEQRRGNGPVAVFLVIGSGVHAQYVAEVFVVCGIVGEVAVHHQQSKQAEEKHQGDFADFDELVGGKLIQFLVSPFNSGQVRKVKWSLSRGAFI
jgi:hypothetical protein